MFDTDLTTLDAPGTIDHMVACRVEAEKLEVAILAAAAHYADLHGTLPATDAGGRALPGAERLVALGGDGTPEVAEFAPAELAAAIGISATAAAALIGDALDLRHRLPLLWARVSAGEVRAWVGRKVADATRTASTDAAALVDARVAPWAGRLSWGRLEPIITAAVTEADPAQAQADAAAAAEAVGVFPGRTTEHGIVTTVLRTTAPDAVRFDASIARVATGLAMFGDTRTVNIRRAAAVGYLADPALTLDLFQHVAAAAAADPATADRIARTDGGPTDADAPELPPDPALDLPSPTTSFATTAGACPSCLGTPDRSSGGAADRRTTRPGASWPGLPRTDATLYVHLTDETLRTGDGVVRVEGIGPVLADQVRSWLSTCEARVTVKPVIDVAGQAPVDGYEVPDRLREAVHLLHPADVFPYATNTGRRQDLDHTLRYRHQRRDGGPPDHEGPPDDAAAPNKDGPPPAHEGPPDIVTAPDQQGPPGGQTRIGNLNKLTRRHHRLKTHGGWQLAQPFPGIWIWRSPHGRHYLVDHTGTTQLGKTA